MISGKTRTDRQVAELALKLAGELWSHHVALKTETKQAEKFLARY